MRMTNEQLIDAAHKTAKYLPPASAQLMSDLATQLDVALAAARTACAERNDLEARCAVLAAENVTLRTPENWLIHSDYGYESHAIAEGNGATKDEALIAGMKAIIGLLPVPATNAFLAGVRAQGVERYAEQLKSEAGRAEETGGEDAAKFLRSESTKVLTFAAQLRQEAK